MAELWPQSLREFVKQFPDDWECIQLYSTSLKKSKTMDAPRAPAPVAYSIWNNKIDYTTVSY